MVLRDDAIMAGHGESHLKTACILAGFTICHPSWYRLCFVLHTWPLGNRKSKQSASS